MYSTVAFVLCVFAVCAAESQYNAPYAGKPSSYDSGKPAYDSGKPAYDSGKPAYNYGNPSYDNGNAEAELDALKDQVSALENRYESEDNKLVDLTLSVAGQKDAINKFYTLDIKQIQLDQYKINKRLEALAQKISYIRNLRSEVKELGEELNAVKNATEDVYIPEVEKLFAKVKDLQASDVEIQASIAELTLKELNVADRIDALFESATVTASELQKLERDVRYVIIALNNVTAVDALATITLNNGAGTTVLPISPKFTRVPQSAPSSIVGFKVVKNKNYTPYSYNYNYNYNQKIKFSTKLIVSDDLIFNAEDDSEGGWSTDSVAVKTLVQ